MPWLAAIPAIASGLGALGSLFNKPKGQSQFQGMLGQYMNSPMAQGVDADLSGLKDQYFQQAQQAGQQQMGQQLFDLNRLGLARGSGRVQLAGQGAQMAAQNRLQAEMMGEQIIQQRRAQHQRMMQMLMGAAQGEQAQNQQGQSIWRQGLAQAVGGIGSGLANYQNQNNWNQLLGGMNANYMQGLGPSTLGTIASGRY